MTDSPVRPLAEWTGRVLLLGAVAFWWGAIVIPRLVDLAFPGFLPSGVTPLHLNPDREGHRRQRGFRPLPANCGAACVRERLPVLRPVENAG